MSSGERSWIDDLRDRQLGNRAQAISAALEEIDAIHRGPFVGWLDGREEQGALFVVVIGDGTPYSVRGDFDPPPSPNRPDDERQSESELSVVPITKHARFTFATTWVAHRWEDAGSIRRRWIFQFPDRSDHPLELESLPPGFPQPRYDDPTPFARALAAEIVRAQRTGDGA